MVNEVIKEFFKKILTCIEEKNSKAMYDECFEVESVRIMKSFVKKRTQKNSESGVQE